MELPQTPASAAVSHGGSQETIVWPPQGQMITKKLSVDGADLQAEGGFDCQPGRHF